MKPKSPRAPNTKVIYAADPSCEYYTGARERQIVSTVLPWIDVDPCTSKRNPMGASVFYTRRDNGLKRANDWTIALRAAIRARGRAHLYVNPPYGLGILPWLLELYSAVGELGAALHALALVPCRPGSRWYAAATTHCQLLCELHGRPTFEDIRGRPIRDRHGRASPARWGCALLYWGPERRAAAVALRSAGVVRLCRPGPRALARPTVDERQALLAFPSERGDGHAPGAHLTLVR